MSCYTSLLPDTGRGYPIHMLESDRASIPVKAGLNMDKLHGLDLTAAHRAGQNRWYAHPNRPGSKRWPVLLYALQSMVR